MREEFLSGMPVYMSTLIRWTLLQCKTSHRLFWMKNYMMGQDPNAYLYELTKYFTAERLENKGLFKTNR